MYQHHMNILRPGRRVHMQVRDVTVMRESSIRRGQRPREQGPDGALASTIEAHRT